MSGTELLAFDDFVTLKNRVQLSKFQFSLLYVDEFMYNTS